MFNCYKLCKLVLSSTNISMTRFLATGIIVFQAAAQNESLYVSAYINGVEYHNN
jgi:hypothetical protein